MRMEAMRVPSVWVCSGLAGRYPTVLRYRYRTERGFEARSHSSGEVEKVFSFGATQIQHASNVLPGCNEAVALDNRP